MRKIAPLSATFTLSAMLGFLLTVLYVYPVSHTWGLTFGIVFVLMFIASMISVTSAPVNDPSFYKELAIHERDIKEEEDFEEETDKEFSKEDAQEAKSQKIVTSKKLPVKAKPKKK